jgi:multidrug resistance efflux pump
MKKTNKINVSLLHYYSTSWQSPLLLTNSILIILFCSLTIFIILIFSNSYYLDKVSLSGRVNSLHEFNKIISPYSGIVDEVFVSNGSNVLQGGKVLSIRNHNNGYKVNIDDINNRIRDVGELIRGNESQISKNIEIIERINYNLIKYEKNMTTLSISTKDEYEINKNITSYYLDQYNRSKKDYSEKIINFESHNRNKINYFSSLKTLSTSEKSLSELNMSSAEHKFSKEVEASQLISKNSSLQNSIIGLREKLEVEKRKIANFVVAANDGFISNMFIKRGSLIEIGDVISGLNNDDPVYEMNNIDIYASVDKSLFVSSGDKVFIDYLALDSSHNGRQEGVIVNVSETIYTRKELNLDSSIFKDNFYKIIRVKAPVLFRTVGGRTVKINEDMIVRVDVEIGKATIFEWLFKPILKNYHANPYFFFKIN